MSGILEQLSSDRQAALDKKRFGLYRGLVRDIDDPETLGRIRAEVPELLGSGQVTTWASYCSPFGGGGAGFFMLPKPGDGVWIMFERGEPTKPVWLGFWFNQTDTPPQGSGADVRILQTKSGHRVIFKDTEGQESITIEDPQGQKIQWKSPDGEILIQANTKVTVKAPVVHVGKGTALSGVQTLFTHPVCYVTGQPIGSSNTVKGES